MGFGLKSGIAIVLLLIVSATAVAYKQLKIAAQAYIYGYPLVLMDLTRQAMDDGEPANGFSHVRTFPDHNFRNVVRPNNDTLYSIAWLNLASEPLVLSVPDTQDRYYVMPLMDAWSNVFAMVGKGSQGTLAANYLIAGPDWNGDIPPDMDLIAAPTNMVWIIGRIQTNGRDDIAHVAGLQEQFQLTPLTRWGSREANPWRVAGQTKADSADREIDPYLQIENMSGADYFSYLARLMGEQAPAPADAAILDVMSGIDLIPGQAFSPGPLQTWLLDKAKTVTHDGVQRQLSRGPDLENGWAVRRELIGTYGDHYGVRAGVSMFGLGALPPTEAVYPNTLLDGQGRALNGEHAYKIHFSAGNLPPADAFWSLTMYDEQGFLVENPIARYAIGDRDPLALNPDGSLDIYVQHKAPADKTENWLPAPVGEFALTLRIYLPTDDFLDGSWQLPPVTRRE